MFIYKGSDVESFGLKVFSEVNFETAAEDIEFIEVAGLDGDIAISKQRLKGVDRTFLVRLIPPENKTMQQAIGDISKWLRSGVSWGGFQYKSDPNYVYTAIHYEEYLIARAFARYGKASLSFKFKPVKYLKTGLESEYISNGRIVYNPESRRSLPLLQITGSGDATINIGSQKLVLKAIDGSITIDSRSQSATKGGLNQFEKMYSYPFPQLNPGGNRITWSGNISRLEITPRWEAVI